MGELNSSVSPSSLSNNFIALVKEPFNPSTKNLANTELKPFFSPSSLSPCLKRESFYYFKR